MDCQIPPYNPNILASGCLGFQVRVWDIAQSACVSMMKFEYSIISLSFHPWGHYLAVASGSKLEMWKWMKGIEAESEIESIMATLPANKRDLMMLSCSGQSKTIAHFRNIRAVVFHPLGEYVFAAAPDQPREPPDTNTPCRLHAFKFSSVFGSGSDAAIELSSISVLLPEIHLYSDGGIDISSDGNYLLTCALLYIPPTISHNVTHSEERCKSSFSPISHTERLDTDEFASNPLLDSRSLELNLAKLNTQAEYFHRQLMNDKSAKLGAADLNSDFSSLATPNKHAQSLSYETAAHRSNAFNSQSSQFNLPSLAVPPNSTFSNLQLPPPVYHSPPRSLRPRDMRVTQRTSCDNFQDLSAGGERDRSLHFLDFPQPVYRSHSSDGLEIGGNHKGPGFKNPPVRLSEILSGRSNSSDGVAVGRSYNSLEDNFGPILPAEPVSPMSTTPYHGSQYLLQSCPPSPAAHTPSSASRQNNTSATTATIMSQRVMTVLQDHQSSTRTYSSPPLYHMGNNNHSGSSRHANNTNNISTSRRILNIPIPAAPMKTRAESIHPADFLVNHSWPNQQQPHQHQHESNTPGGSYSDSKGSTQQPCKAPRKRLLLLHSPRKTSTGSLPYGWTSEEHLCLFQLCFEGDNILPPKLLTTKHLPGSLMKAVTSTKLSPTCRYALVGYGVRLEGVVQDHPEKNVACEVVSLRQSTNLRTVATMSDKEDEVNVAQFHPRAGGGIVYGTKKGKEDALPNSFFPFVQLLRGTSCCCIVIISTINNDEEDHKETNLLKFLSEGV
eukprot:CAMPEP_0170101732 /NCGR_PEP_ID=MMETSP0020_2-20130122/2435_1 /TAXON_ID=98059 /ORGANISM="Dinobryon sp., Strain UTEXLB2267" /LENGTH=780 /DNA_ID=CAMNT_0010324887 /DNA_START=325 /DNA_END=2666 /DNA_ORIENTATION=-